jgi:integrase
VKTVIRFCVPHLRFREPGYFVVGVKKVLYGLQNYDRARTSLVGGDPMRRGISPRPRVHDLRHRCDTNAVRSGMNLLIADMIVGHGDRRKDLRSVYLTAGDHDLVREIDMMRFDIGETEIWLEK